MPVVRIPTQMRNFTGGLAEVEGNGATVAELLADLEARYPGLQERLVDPDGGELRRFVNLYVNDDDIRFLNGMDTQLPEGASIAVIPAIAGG